MANALNSRDYRLLWIGSLISSVGEGMREVAEDWLVIVMTGSPLLLGVVSFSKGVSRLVIGPVMGVIVDRVDRKRLMLVGQLTHSLITAVFAVLVTFEVIEYWHIIVLTVIDGLVAPAIRVARHTIIPALVPREHLMNAISLHSLGSHAAHVIGPFLGGILIVWLGVDGVLWLMSVSFLGIVVSLLLMRVQHRPEKSSKLKVVGEISESLRFVRSHRAVRQAMVMQFFSFLLALPFTRLLPVYAKDIMAIGPTGLGLLRGAFAAGNVVGGLGLLSIGEAKGQSQLQLLAGGVFAAAIVAFSHTFWLPVAMFLLVVAGLSSMIFRVTSFSVIQLNVPDEMRGRVMGLYNLEAGFRSIGGLLYGACASAIGTPLTVAAGGVSFGVLMFLASDYTRRKWGGRFVMPEEPLD